eukprot:540226_1
MANNNKIYITIGIDVGGTNTDVAIRLESEESKLNVIASAKHATTKDVTTGIVLATKQALKTVYDLYKNKAEIYINCVSIGTTHFVNAIEQRSKELSQICVIRLCGPVSNAFIPFIDIPNDLKQIIEGCSYLIDGGYDYNGKVITELETKENDIKIDKIVADIKSKNLKSIAITGIFSPMVSKDKQQEIKLEQILRKKLGNEYCKDTYFTLSHKIAGLGLLPRENAAILNAAICKLAEKTIQSFKNAMENVGITSTLYLTKNDGTQCDSNDAIKYPITTFASGPTNSMKGAALLYNSEDISTSTIIVCDIGGTTSDIGMLVNGFIQLSATKCQMAGIETNFAVPNVISKALGGGTIVYYDKDTNKVNGIGPKSVGYNLIKSKCFENGNILTLTDVAVFNGNITPNALSNTYNKKIITDKLNDLESIINQASDMMISKLTELVDAARGEKNDLTLILCGGGAKLIPPNININGIKNIIIPQYAEVANAIGAASYRISAHLDVMHSFEGKERDQEIENLKQIVIDKAEADGAKKGTVTIATFESIPIAYIPGDFKRILIKAVGDVDSDIMKNKAKKWIPNEKEMDNISTNYEFNLNEDDMKQDNNRDTQQQEYKQEIKEEKDINEYKRNLSDNGKIWTLTTRDIEYLSIGCGVVGTGGGGSTRPFDILCKKYIASGNKIRIVKPDILDDNCNVICVAFMGAPAMLSEKLMNGSELLGVVEEMGKHLGLKSDDKIALICGEIGGCNGLTPIIACGQFAEKNKGKTIDLVDGDFMGRAFPELQMILPSIHGKNIAPISCQDEYGNKAILKANQVENNKDAENKMRFKCVELGMKMAISLCPLKGNEINKYCIPNSYEMAWTIGKIIYEAKEKNINPLLQLQKCDNELIGKSKIVYYGKIIKLTRENDGGFNKGSVKLQKIVNNNDEKKYINDDNIYIDIQNENYLIRTDSKVLITVPDLIVMFDDDYRAIATEELRYGLRVKVMIFPAHPLMKTNDALKVVGPAAFGYKDVKYIPIENFKIQ